MGTRNFHKILKRFYRSLNAKKQQYKLRFLLNGGHESGVFYIFPLLLKAMKDPDISEKWQCPVLNLLHSVLFPFNLLSKQRFIFTKFGLKCNRNLKVF